MIQSIIDNTVGALFVSFVPRMNCDRLAYKSLHNGERQRDADGYRIRAAGVCVRGSGEDTVVLLVSAGKDGEKWVIPGGGVEKGEAAEAAASREVEEEAGIRGRTKETIGVFQDDSRKHRTTVFLIQEEVELSEWIDGQVGRRRCWMPIPEALSKIKPSHIDILRSVITRYNIDVPLQ